MPPCRNCFYNNRIQTFWYPKNPASILTRVKIKRRGYPRFHSYERWCISFSIFPSFGLTCLSRIRIPDQPTPFPVSAHGCTSTIFRPGLLSANGSPSLWPSGNVLFPFIAFLLLFLKFFLSQNMQSAMFCQQNFSPRPEIKQPIISSFRLCPSSGRLSYDGSKNSAST